MKAKQVTKFKRIQYNCVEAQKLAIKRQETKLRPTENIRLKIHMKYCSICRDFEKFSVVVNKVFSASQKIYKYIHHLV